MNELQEKLRLILHECNQHKIMIHHAFSHIEPYVPEGISFKLYFPLFPLNLMRISIVEDGKKDRHYGVGRQQ